MVAYDKRVINQLLDTYENSLLSIGENKRKVQIEMRFTKTLIPAYFDESSNEYENIHILMKTLESRKLIDIIWKNNKKDYVIQKIRLVTEHLDEAYQYAGRTPKRGLEMENIGQLQSFLTTDTPITKRFAEYLIERLQKHQSVKEYIDIQNYCETKRFLQACRLVEQNKNIYYLREFSILHFNDSKYFEHIEARVVKVFKRFSDEYKEMDMTEILAEYGIYRNPNYVYFKGNAILEIGGGTLDLSQLQQGIGISGEDIGKIQFTDFKDVKKVITIENLTSFFRYHEDESLFIYLGGYHNTIRRNLLNKIHAAIPDAEYCHFGDIDAGGFSILLDLRKKTGISFKSYHMNLDTLKKYKQYGKELTELDRKRLVEIRKLGEFREVIDFMLENNLKLEQECVYPKN